MKTSNARFALDLARTGISVLHRNARGLWQPMGNVPLNAPDFELELARLRKTVADSFGEDFQVDIWLPEEQVVYCAVRLMATEKTARNQEIRDAVAAMSRIDASQMCICEGVSNHKGHTHIAAISKETRREAVAFAQKWGFNARIVTTRLPAKGFEMAPVFSHEAARPVIKKVSKLPGVIAAGLAMALMLPAALQFTPDQNVAGELIVMPAQITLEPSERGSLESIADKGVDEPKTLEKGPEFTLAPELGAAPKAEERSQVRLPGLAEGVERDITRDLAATKIGVFVDANDATYPVEDKMLDVLHTGPTIFADTVVIKSSPFEDKLDVIRPENSGEVRSRKITDAFLHQNPAPEVVDQHAQLWVSHLPLQPAFRKSGPSFERPALNALRRSPGILRLSRKLNFAPDDIPGLSSLISSDAKRGFLERSLRVIYFDEKQEQALLDLNVRSIFAIGAERVVANIGSEILLERPSRRVVNDANAPTDFERPARRDGSDLVPEPLVEPAPSIEEIVVEPLRPAPIAVAEPPIPENPADVAVQPAAQDPDPVAITRPTARTANADDRPEEAVLSSEDEMILARPKRRETPEVQAPDVSAPEVSEGQDFRRPERRKLVAKAPVVQTEVAEPEVAVQEAAPETPQPLENRAVLTPETRIEPGQEIEASDLFLPRPKHRPRVEAVVKAIEPEVVKPEVLEPEPEVVQAPVSAFAIASARSPKARPKRLKSAADKIRAERNSVEKVVAKTHSPKKTVPASNLRLPSNASVKRAATIRNGINLSKISLLGVSGTSSQRKAMIRLPRGKVISVKRGARVDGWRVSAIGEESVRLQKGNRSQVLRMPN